MRRSFASNDEGAIAVEFCILVPVMLVLLFGSFEVTRLVRASFRATNAAQTIADLVAQQDTVNATSMSNFCTGGQLVMIPFAASGLVATAASVTYSSTGRSVDWQDTTCGGGASITAAATLAANYTPNIKDSVVVVRVVYTYTPILKTVITGPFVMTRLAYARPRNGTSVGHS